MDKSSFEYISRDFQSEEMQKIFKRMGLLQDEFVEATRIIENLVKETCDFPIYLIDRGPNINIPSGHILNEFSYLEVHFDNMQSLNCWANSEGYCLRGRLNPDNLEMYIINIVDRLHIE